jgi:hypothetical protein
MFSWFLGIVLLCAGCEKPASKESVPAGGVPAAVAPDEAPASAPTNSPQAVESAVESAAETRAESAAPSTPAGQPAVTRPVNHLAGETSPYLKMHAHNPVDWYPWGEEALKKARDEKKLIFLSVGYSSCYWCHVMERESFMDDEISRFLNEHFVCIKVDREERPDIDSIYMMALQVISGSGGWPMSVFLTPEGQPFLGGTYFPARDGDRGGLPGFLTVLQKTHDFWQKKSDVVRDSAGKLTDLIRAEMAGETVAADLQLDRGLVDSLKLALANDFDPQYGGFSFDPADPQRPKFPEASNLLFLLDCVQRTGDEECRKMLLTTVDALAQGGIWDHLAGGFHRYSTDRYWTIPHFEKMLYDNGQLLSVYSWAYQQTSREDYRLIADRIAGWLNAEMRDAGGAFHAALDAESERVEGKYYRWAKEELEATLGDQWDVWSGPYELTAAPNFEEEFIVLRLGKAWPEAAQQAGVSVVDLDGRLAEGRKRLLAARSKRVRPLTDGKVLCGWNGLAIRGLADAGYHGKRPEHIEAAVRVAEFVLGKLRDGQGRLLRTYNEGQARLTAYLDDYAFVIDGLLGLHRATGDERWLREADTLMQQQIRWYADEQQAGFFFTASDHEELLVRLKLWIDEAVPAGNSLTAHNLLYLAQALQRPEYRERAEKLVLQATPMLQKRPRMAPRLVSAVAELTADAK